MRSIKYQREFSKQVTLNSHAVGSVAVVVITVVLAGVIELYALRLVIPNLSFSDMWGQAFVLGVLHSFAGAATLGAVLVGLGWLVPLTRAFSKRFFPAIWLFGALFFLGGMGALVIWGHTAV